VYGWTVTGVSILLIVRQLVRVRGSRRRETAIFLASTVAPAIANVPDSLGLTPGWPDLTPFAFGLTAAGIAWVLFRFRFQAIIPVAWKAIFQGMDDGVLVLDAENRVLVVNAAAERFLGSTSELIIGRSIDGPSATCPALGRLAKADSIAGDIELGTESVKRICEVRVSPLCDKRNQLVGCVLIIRDVTAVRAAARELEEARQAAEAANRAKSQFLANMSHEIRTPMNGVLGMIDVALENGVAPEHQECLAMARSSAEALLTVINDILDFSKIEANRLELDPGHFNLGDCLEETLKSFAVAAARKEIELTCEIRPEVPAVVKGDRNRLRQVITNLLGNAMKFTPKGEVCLRVADDMQTGNRGRLHFTVSDTGIGIPADKQKLIFDAFAQGDSSVARSYGGTGLGLTISAHLIGLMGGEIWVRSEPGSGSEFHFTMALEPVVEEPSLRLRTTAFLAGVRVLLVDDNATARRVLGETLECWGMCPTVVSDGRAALAELATANREGRPFRLLLADARMPELDGFAVAQEARLNSELGSPTVVLLTCYGRNADIDRGRELAISACVNKPVGRRELADTLYRLLNPDFKTEPAATVSPGPANPEAHRTAGTLRILLAEDNRINQLLAKKLLEQRGHLVTLANNGQEALDLLAASDFDLVLMDVQMPKMGGFEATAAIRAREILTGRHVPIIAMTANAMRGDRERCLDAGMDQYLAKPIRPQEFFAAIEAIRSGVTIR
jgi:signal transduction histidine kinase/CheY-like chemotaxis protein